MSEKEKPQEVNDDDIKSEYLGLSEKTRQILQRGKFYLIELNRWHSMTENFIKLQFIG